MAAAVEGAPRAGKKGKPQKRRVTIRIDMTPMVDIAFLLLIFFMVTTVFRAPQSMEINLPPSEQKVEVAESNLLTLRVIDSGTIYWNIAKERPQKIGIKDLRKFLEEKNRANPKMIVLVKLDRKTHYAMMIDILDELQLGNINRFSFTSLTDADKEVLKTL
ncbi:MAG: biopolymer transporter ExbD [Candidatus Latescibacteria bacterium]|nr:biopolymer transporter ExbD [Candidatus Latescibacterota bacterium]